MMRDKVKVEYFGEFTYKGEKMKRIVLINPPDKLGLDNIIEIPIGLLYIQAFTKKNGHDCIVHDSNIYGESVDDIPVGDVYAFSTYSHNYKWCLDKKRELKARDKNSICVAGGYFVSALPNECKKDWDHIVVGRGEEGLLKALGLEYIPIKTIDDYPFPVYTEEMMNDYSRRAEDGQRILSVLGSRGCPNRCNFCGIQITRLYPCAPRTDGKIMKEIYIILEKHLHHIKFNDDNFLHVIS